MNETEQLAKSLSELNDSLKRLQGASGLLYDYRECTQRLLKIESRVKKLLKNSAALTDGTLNIYGQIIADQQEIKNTLTTKTQDLQKRLTIYEESLADRLDDLAKEQADAKKSAEDRMRRERESLALEMKGEITKAAKAQNKAVKRNFALILIFGCAGIAALAAFLILGFAG